MADPVKLTEAQVIAKWLFNRDHDGGPDALYHPNQQSHWAAAYEAEANDLLAALAADAAPLAALAMREACLDVIADVYAVSPTIDKSSTAEITDAIRAIPLPNEAAITAAALTLPKVKALVEAAVRVGERGLSAGQWLSRVHELADAIAVLPPASKGWPK